MLRREEGLQWPQTVRRPTRLGGAGWTAIRPERQRRSRARPRGDLDRRRRATTRLMASGAVDPPRTTGRPRGTVHRTGAPKGLGAGLRDATRAAGRIGTRVKVDARLKIGARVMIGARTSGGVAAPRERGASARASRTSEGVEGLGPRVRRGEFGVARPPGGTAVRAPLGIDVAATGVVTSGPGSGALRARAVQTGGAERTGSEAAAAVRAGTSGRVTDASGPATRPAGVARGATVRVTAGTGVRAAARPTGIANAPCAAARGWRPGRSASPSRPSTPM